jgi:hypothetical protein
VHAWGLLERGRFDPERHSGLGTQDETGEQRGGRALLCSVCRAPATSDLDRIEVEGAHEHTFANPFGHLFRIGCFGSANGCLVWGEPSHEFPWFSGHTWQLALCRGCGVQLGWCFVGPGRLFFGLVLDRLVEDHGEDG